MTSSQLARPPLVVLAGVDDAAADSWAATAGVGVVGRSRGFFLGAMVDGDFGQSAKESLVCSLGCSMAGDFRDGEGVVFWTFVPCWEVRFEVWTRRQLHEWGPLIGWCS